MSIPQRAAIVVSVSLALLFSFPAVAGADNVDRGLLERYQPVTYLDPAEQFGPASIQSFVSDANLERFDAGSWSLADPVPEPGDLPGPGTGTWRLNQDSCTPSLPVGGLACYATAGSEGTGASVVYGRVARQPGAIVLEYWYFYYDDVYSYTYPASDFIWQAHEGDWENVDVVLSDDEAPQFVGYSQHCLGQRRGWSSTPLLGTHPIVHVAAGSHANYFSAGIHPINVQCIPPPAIAFDASDSQVSSMVRAPSSRRFQSRGGRSVGGQSRGSSPAATRSSRRSSAWRHRKSPASPTSPGSSMTKTVPGSR